MNLTAILGIALAIALAGDAILGKLYVGAEQKIAQVQQAFDSFKADVKVLGERAAADAAKQKADDEKRKRDADAENSATVAARDAAIVKLRAERDRARRSLVPAAPAGSKCPDDQACFDRASLESALREYRDAVRRLADEGAALEADLNTARKWAQAK